MNFWVLAAGCLVATGQPRVGFCYLMGVKMPGSAHLETVNEPVSIVGFPGTSCWLLGNFPDPVICPPQPSPCHGVSRLMALIKEEAAASRVLAGH